MFKNLIILILVFLIWLSYFSKGHSTEQKNQYYGIKITLINLIGGCNHKKFNICLEEKNLFYW